MSIIFALDSSGVEASVCLLGEAGVLFEKEINEGLTHSETLLPLVQEGFAAAALGPADVSLFAANAGPGSFTGLRIGLSLAKGMAFPGGTPLAPVSTLLALALASGQKEGTVVPALNARRGEVYAAAFDMADGCVRRLADTAGPAADLEPVLANLRPPIIFVGSGAEICYTLYTEKYAVDCTALRYPLAHGVALAARQMAAQGAPLPAEEARPSYLRLSQAERERRQRMLRQET